MTPPFDVILHGATGFTGRLIAAYLLGSAPDHLRWAMSGRNAEKLKELHDALRAQDKTRAEAIGLIQADSLIEADMMRLVSQTRTVISVVGPYSLYGKLLVKACVEQGVDCVDLTGENPFVKDMADRHHDLAREKGLRIVNSCGFDSIPSDLGVWMMQQEAIRRFEKPLQRIEMVVSKLSGGLSGGTMASMLNLLETRHDPMVRRATGHPYGLNPKDGVRGQDGSDLRGVQWSEAHQAWVGPFIMAAINTRIVRRSHALLKWPWGEDFRYSEASSFGKGFKGWRRAQSMAIGLGLFVALLLFKPSRSVLRGWFLPKPGDGPSQQKRAKGRFQIVFYGVCASGEELRGVVGAKLDPGYDCTALMIAESALALVLNRDELPDNFGVLTPSTAFGDVLLTRLKKAGMQFDIEE